MYGAQAKGMIEASIARYRTLYRISGVSWEQACARAFEHRQPIAEYRPALLHELDGIAAGAGLSPQEIIALNLRTEIIVSAQVRSDEVASGPSECTALGVSADRCARGAAILAQNWDYMEGARESTIVLEVHAPDGPSFITVVEAGLLAKMGMNQAGVALVTNALATRRDVGHLGVPYHLMLRAALESTCLAEAAAALRPAVRASSGNFMLAAEDGALVDFEVWAGGEGCFEMKPGDGTLVHTNHCLTVPEGEADVPFMLSQSSRPRLTRAEDLLASTAAIAVQDVKSILSDHEGYPYSICAHVNPSDPALSRGSTSASLIMVPAERVMLLAAGNPCQAPYQLIDTSCLKRRSPRSDVS